MKGNPGLEKVEDINVLCGVIKVFLRNLREPLLTFRMHNTFMQAAGQYLNHIRSCLTLQYRTGCVRPAYLLQFVICSIMLSHVVTFVPPAEAANEEEALASTLESIAELPPCNKDTLAFMILHLQK